jgi:His-Xaa-Ser system protein HxsD
MTPTLDPRKHTVSWTFRLATYPLDAVYGAAYVFLDRAYVYLDKPDRQRLHVVLKGKTPLDREGLEALGGDFAGELLHQVMRLRIAERTSKVRELLVGRALLAAGAMDDPGSEPDLELPGADGDYLDDPLGIAIPWEEKYGNPDGTPQP